MDVSDAFMGTLAPYYFSSYEELQQRMKEFEMASGVQYYVRRSIRLQDSVPNSEVYVYKYLQYVCSCAKSGGCPSKITVCHSYGTLRISRYYLVHNHGVEEIQGTGIYEKPIEYPFSTDAEVDSSVATDQTLVFQEYVPLRTFNSFEELESLLNTFQQATGCLLVKRNSIRYPETSPEHRTLVYKSITYACCHYGSGRSLATKIQQQKTRKINCPCIIRVGCRGKKLHIIDYVMRHNHPVTTDLAGNYPENRRLTEEERLEITDILQSAPNNFIVRDHIERRFRKTCTLNDVRQMKYRLRKMQKSIGEVSQQQSTDEGDGYAMEEWSDQSKDGLRLTQFDALSNQLAELVCLGDQEVFCDRMELLKELADAWRSGKQPMLTYSESMIRCEDVVDEVEASPVASTEVVTSDEPHQQPAKSFLLYQY